MNPEVKMGESDCRSLAKRLSLLCHCLLSNLSTQEEYDVGEV
jgi:hypothetical protein